MTYQFYSDPAHGWIKVSIEELEKLEIEKQISKCSYMKNGFAYLEEDCDLSLFFKAKNITDFEKNVKLNRQSNKMSKIRNYHSYDYDLYRKQEDAKDRYDNDPLFRHWVLKVIARESKSNWLDQGQYPTFDSFGKNGKAWFIHLVPNLDEKIKLEMESWKIYLQTNKLESKVHDIEIQMEMMV